MRHLYFSSPEEGVAVAVGTEDASNSATQSEPQFQVSFFHRLNDKIPKAKKFNWSDFCQQFSTHQESLSKESVPLWSPACYANGDTRAADNVQSVCMGVLDIDGGAAPEAILARLKGWAYLAHSTHSHTAVTPSFRVVIPFSKPVSALEWSKIWVRLNILAFDKNDPSTKDAGRIYFLPSRKPGADKFVQIEEGTFLDPDRLPALPKPVVIPIQLKTAEDRTNVGTDTEFHEVFSRCNFMRVASDPANQPSVVEPHWQAMISNACRFDAEEWIHQASEHHPDYDPEKTDRKIESTRNGSGPITCRRIQELGFKGCPSGGCKLPGGRATAAPAGLGVWANTTKEPESSKESSSEKKSYVEKCRDLIEKLFDGNLIYVNQDFYGYANGYWSRLDEEVEVKKRVFDHFGDHVKLKDVGTYVEYFKMIVGGKEVPEATPSLIGMRNGVLDASTGQLLPHSPKHWLKGQIAVDWDPKAVCPLWLKTLDEIFAPDQDKAEKIAFLSEWFGYSLVPDVRQHKFIWMVGAGGNGKSVVLNILTEVVGPANVSHAQLERLDRAFVRADLQNKLVNISSEMGAEATVADGYLKAIVSGDVIEAERKFQDPFSFKPFARLVGATNALPRLLDNTDGFFRRAIILTFNRKFEEHEQDRRLEDKLRLELPGIVRWAVEGLQRLQRRGQFEIPQSSKDAVSAYRVDSDPVQMFASECLKKDSSAKTRPSEIFAAYTDWCTQFGYHRLSEVRFGIRLQTLGFVGRKTGGQKIWEIRLLQFWDHENAIIKAEAREFPSNVHKLQV